MDPITAGAGAASGAIDLIKQVDNFISGADAYLGGKSLIDVTRHARVEPLLIVDADLLNLAYLPDVAQTMQSLFAGYYLQAVEILTNIGNIKVAERLAPLNPNRKTEIGLMSHSDTWKLAKESYTHALPTNQRLKKMALEAIADDEYNHAKAGSAVIGNKVNENIVEATNLSVGKLYDIKIKNDENEAVVKVAIRVMAQVMPTSSLTAMLSVKSMVDNDLKERFHGWRAGRLSFIRDLILCQDLIEKHRNASISDKTGTYDEIITRRNDSVTAGLLERNPSMAVASNLCIMSSDTLEQVEERMMGSIGNMRVRKAIFDTTNMMILAVVDKGYDRITFYHRGISQTSEMSVRDIQQSNKGTGPNVLDIMKSFMAGHTPSL
jgi:hypothetical protein